MDIAITGSSGLIGSALVRSLEDGGHRVIRMVRRRPRPGADEISWDPEAGTLDESSLEGVEAVVNLAGAPIGTRPWTKAYKHKCVTSRVHSTALLAGACASLTRPPRLLVSGSAIGYYGTGRNDPPSKAHDEQAPKGEGFLADLCAQWEAATQSAEDAGIRTVHLRTGLVMAAEGGLLGRLKPLFKLGLGGRLGSGRQVMSWISLVDMVAAVGFIIDSGPVDGGGLSGPVNVVAPTPVTNAEFTTTLASVLGRPAFAHVPAIVPRIVLGREMATEFILADQAVAPAVLQRAGFEFTHPDLDQALGAILKT